MTSTQRIAVRWYGRRSLRFRLVWYIEPAPRLEDLRYEPGHIIMLQQPHGISEAAQLRVSQLGDDWLSRIGSRP